MTKKNQTILFLGCGNMTQAILKGLIDNEYSPQKITVFDRHPEKLTQVSRQYNINTTEKLMCDYCDADIIVLSVKPQNAKDLCSQLKPLLQNKKTVVLSVMAGVTIKTLKAWLGETILIIRAMPNTPALLKAGATGLFADNALPLERKNSVESILSSVGITTWLENETQVDAITALSGSGPAYFFLMIEAMQSAAVKLGLPKVIADQFAIQTAYGASLLALNSEESVSELRECVTSKGGTTEAAISVFQKKELFGLVEEAMRAAKDKSAELSKKIK